MATSGEERLRNKIESMAEEAGITVAKTIYHLQDQAISQGATGGSRERMAVAEALSDGCIDTWRRMSRLMIQRGQKDENLLRRVGSKIIVDLWPAAGSVDTILS